MDCILVGYVFWSQASTFNKFVNCFVTEVTVLLELRGLEFLNDVRGYSCGVSQLYFTLHHLLHKQSLLLKPESFGEHNWLINSFDRQGPVETTHSLWGEADLAESEFELLVSVSRQQDVVHHILSNRWKGVLSLHEVVTYKIDQAIKVMGRVLDYKYVRPVC